MQKYTKLQLYGIYLVWAVIFYALVFMPGYMLAEQLQTFYPDFWLGKILAIFFFYYHG